MQLADQISVQINNDTDKLDDMRRLIDAQDNDLFDVLAYVRFTMPTKTRNAAPTMLEIVVCPAPGTITIA
ncbi:MAG: hypothetical protein ACI8XZ_002049 [Gammaproteobacteria bacterium]